MILERRTTNDERRTGGLPAAFTLIEVLVAMTVLAILVLMAANIFQSSSASWNIGTQKADMNTAARAALDFMARELQSAVAGPIETVAVGANPSLDFNLFSRNEIRFVSLLGEPGNGSRALNASLFRWKDNILQYHRETASFNPYTQVPGWSSGTMLITNVLSLNFYVYRNEADLIAGVYIPDIGVTPIEILPELPICVDIALEMLSDDDMQRYNQLTVLADKTAFSKRNAKLYSTRIYFPNRKGYGGR